MIAGALYWQGRSASTQPSAPAPGAIRTATVKTGVVESTIRLSGATAAENFVSLITPQLRFSRSDRLRDGGAAAPPSSGGSATPAATASNSSAAAHGGSSPAPGASSAFKSATSRFGGSLRGSAPASS